MTYGICNLTAIAMRKEARHASEMVSQLLYNETYTVLDTTKEWVLIQTEDGAYPYQGWIQTKQFCEIGEEEFNDLKGKTPYLINKPVVQHNGLLLTMGTPVDARRVSSRPLGRLRQAPAWRALPLGRPHGDGSRLLGLDQGLRPLKRTPPAPRRLTTSKGGRIGVFPARNTSWRLGLLRR